MKFLIKTSSFIVLLSMLFFQNAAESSQFEATSPDQYTYYSDYPCENTMIQTLYFKAGSGLGIGYRAHRDMGYDISINYTEWGIGNWLSFKGSFLYYPFKRLYAGVGAGIICETTRFSLGDNVDHHGKATYPTLDAMIGYEFYCGEKFTWFVQLEIAKPLSKRAMGECLPALYVGVGF